MALVMSNSPMRVHLVVRKYLGLHGHKRLNHLCFKNMFHYLTIFFASFHWVPHLLITAITAKKIPFVNKEVLSSLFKRMDCTSFIHTLSLFNQVKFPFASAFIFELPRDHIVKSLSFIRVRLATTILVFTTILFRLSPLQMALYM